MYTYTHAHIHRNAHLMLQPESPDYHHRCKGKPYPETWEMAKEPPPYKLVNESPQVGGIPSIDL